ncbi:MAG: hypothetical protein ABR517_05170 [Thermoanaerobaculia bacterium]
MIKRMWFQRVGVLMFAAAMLVPLSIFADSGPGWRTGEQVTVEARRAQWDLEGTVLSVHSSGDRFALRTSRGTVQIEAKGGIKVRDGNRTLRVRDLRRGERVGVDLRHRNDRRLHAREVFLIAERGYRDDRYRDDRYRDDRYRDDRRLTLLEGEVVTLSAPGDILVIRQYRGGNVRVDARPLQRRYGRDWARSLRRGQRVRLFGQFARGGIFLADSLDERGWGDRHSRR